MRPAFSPRCREDPAHRGLLISLFIEMTHPGLALPGSIAAVCLVGLVLPPILAGIAGWWTLLAIMAGIGLICCEIFLTPGMAIFGVVGVLLLFAGLVGTFLVGPGMGNMFPAWGAAAGRSAGPSRASSSPSPCRASPSGSC